jgi:hypothetical protein
MPAICRRTSRKICNDIACQDHNQRTRPGRAVTGIVFSAPQAALALIAVFLSCELAESQTFQDQGPTRVSEITIVPGRVRVVPLPRSGTAIHVGDDTVVSAQPGVMANTIVVRAIKPGSTNIVVLDDNDRTILDATILVPGNTTPGGTNVRIHSKCGASAGSGASAGTCSNPINEYWAYHCTPTGCIRTDDPHEGPVLYPGLRQPPEINVNTNNNLPPGPQQP